MTTAQQGGAQAGGRSGRGIARAAGRLGWGLADQALSSLTNFTVSLLVARQVGIEQLGIFSLVFATYLLALGVSRSLNSDPLLVRYSAADPGSWRQGTTMAGGGALGFGAVAGAACAIAGAVVGGLLGSALLVLAVSLPGLLLQDAWRFAFIAAGRSFHAFLNDLVWTVVLIPTLVLLVVSGHSSVIEFQLAWGGAAGVAALVGIAQAGLRPWPANPLAWWRRHRDLNARYLAEFLAIGGASQLTSYGVNAVAGLAAVGVLRAGEILMGPIHVLFMGGNVVAVAEGARIGRGSPSGLARMSVLVSAAMSVAAALWGRGPGLAARQCRHQAARADLVRGRQRDRAVSAGDRRPHRPGPRAVSGRWPPPAAACGPVWSPRRSCWPGPSAGRRWAAPSGPPGAWPPETGPAPWCGGGSSASPSRSTGHDHPALRCSRRSRRGPGHTRAALLVRDLDRITGWSRVG